ncbi:MAG: hypothetical protein MUC67_12385 [Acidobacteria bacterium]|jgi:hypothetical protein|nr:hypothetical protein [Acidobacteriota bacterium]
MSLKNGTYRARPLSAVLGFTQSGSPQIAVEFAIVDPPGERIVWYGYFTDKTWERTEDALRYCGWNGSDISDFSYGNPLPVGFDQEVELVVEEELDQEGRPRPRVRWVNSGAGVALRNVMTTAQAKQFAAELRAKIMLRAKGQGAKPASGPKPLPAPTPAPAAVADDDIPF